MMLLNIWRNLLKTYSMTLINLRKITLNYLHQDSGKAFENLEFQVKHIIEEYDTESIETYLRRLKLRRSTQKSNVKWP